MGIAAILSSVVYNPLMFIKLPAVVNFIHHSIYLYNIPALCIYHICTMVAFKIKATDSALNRIEHPGAKPQPALCVYHN